MFTMTETQAHEWRIAVRTVAHHGGYGLLPLNLNGAKLTGAKLGGANMTGANMTGADMEGTTLRGANMEGTTLRGANMEGTTLRDTTLIGADMTGADLRYTNMTGANMTGADMEGATLNGATLNGANMTGAKLDNVIMNWQSHELVGVRLMQAPGDDYDLLTLAGGISTTNSDYRWQWWLDNTPPGIRDKALRIMATWVRDGDNAPDILKQYAQEND